MNKQIKDFLAFLNGSPTSVQAREEICQRLEAAQFTRLTEDKKWGIKPGGKYYVVRATSVIAFVAGSQSLSRTGFH
nr:M18 family aminopeptidase [Candidatus Cloacimonadota bacterium]